VALRYKTEINSKLTGFSQDKIIPIDNPQKNLRPIGADFLLTFSQLALEIMAIFPRSGRKLLLSEKSKTEVV
jgi:hypothetical protein